MNVTVSENSVFFFFLLRVSLMKRRAVFSRPVLNSSWLVIEVQRLNEINNTQRNNISVRAAHIALALRSSNTRVYEQHSNRCGCWIVREETVAGRAQGGWAQVDRGSDRAKLFWRSKTNTKLRRSWPIRFVMLRRRHVIIITGHVIIITGLVRDGLECSPEPQSFTHDRCGRFEFDLVSTVLGSGRNRSLNCNRFSPQCNTRKTVCSNSLQSSSRAVADL